MLSTTTGLPASVRFHPRRGDRAVSKRPASEHAEIVHLNARLLAVEKDLRVQFERIAQMQEQLDRVTKLLEKLARK
jgi:hypothetical protein